MKIQFLRFGMKKSDLSPTKFNHRPSTSYILSTKAALPQKKHAVRSKTTSDEKVLTFKDFQYVLKENRSKESVSRNNSINKGRKNYQTNNSLFDTQIQTDPLSKALKKERLGLVNSSLENVLFSDVNNEYLEFVYFTSAYVINNYFGAKSEKLKELIAFINQLIPLPIKTKQDCFAKAQKVKAPNYLLNVQLIEATDLEIADVDGSSDPFCKVWMNNQRESLKETSVQEHTLNPVWNESFRFRISDLHDDVLHIEIWDKDPKGLGASIRQIGKIKGSRGFNIFCRECCRRVCCCHRKSVDDFLGKVDVSVKEIHSEGIDEWLLLKDKKDKDVSGQIHISAEFEAMRSKLILDALKRHLLLFKIILLQYLEKNRNPHYAVTQWDHFLPPSAFVIVFQHRIQSSLTLNEDVLCRYIVFVYLLNKREQPISYQFLYNITNEAFESEQQLLNNGYGVENCLENLYRDAVNNVCESCKSVINTLHSIDFNEDESKRVEFEFVLRCISICYEILGEKESELWTVFQEESKKWLRQVFREMDDSDPETRTEFIIKILNYTISYHSSLDKILRKVFPDESYTRCTCEIFDSLMSEKLKLHIAKIIENSTGILEDVKGDKLQEALKLYVNVKELNEYLSGVPIPLRKELQLNNFRKWFGSNIVEAWFRWKQQIVIKQMELIVFNDSLENVFIECAGRVEKQSLSVKSTSNLIQKELIQLWDTLSCSKYETHNFIFLEALHSTCMKFVELQLDLINLKNFSDSIRNNKLCVIANNLWSLAIYSHKAVSDTVINIPPDSFDTKFSLKVVCYIICRDMSKDQELEIFNQIKNVVDANSVRKQVSAINIFVNRINQLLWKNVVTHMAFEIFALYSREIWKIIVKTVRFFKDMHADLDSVSAFNACKNICFRPPNISAGLLAILTETEKICFIDDQGKLKQFMWTDDYKKLKTELQLSLVPR